MKLFETLHFVHVVHFCLKSAPSISFLTHLRTPCLSRPSHIRETHLPSHPMEPCTSDEFFQALNHAEQTFKKMENYLRHKQLCDVVLVAGERRIPAHRLVLSSVSDYFAAMFTNDVREARQEEIKMEGVEPNALWALVQYAYTGRLELKEENIECLLSTACILQLSQVVEACCKFLMKQLHPSNCLGIRSFADAQGCTDLHKVAHNYTMEHFMEVIRNQEFLLLPATEIAKLLASDDMNIPSEETILSALLTWVQHDLEQRKKDLSKLLAYIRLPLLAPQFLADMENNLLFRDDIDCQKLIMEAMKYHLLPERRPMLQSPRTKPRKSTVGVLYDPKTDMWTAVASMSISRDAVGVCLLGDKLYAVGGYDGQAYLNTVESYDPQINEWTQ
ncbi:hypothetical protein Chor_010891, partial [Crotalus horridus]